MVLNPRVVAVIPARRDSRRLPKENWRDLCGKPLVCWTVEVAQQCEFIDEILITTNSLEVIEACQRYYEDNRVKIIMREERICLDDTQMWEVVEDATLHLPDSTICILLQPTSPLRTVKDIKTCFSLFKKYKLGIVSAWKPLNDPTHSITINGAIYIHFLMTLRLTRSFIHLATILYFMPEEKSYDIDTIEDFLECERVLEERLKK